MIRFLIRMLTWWNDQTLGTQLYTWSKGKRVGEDEQGNVYYTNAKGKNRWVIYNGQIEASRVSPEWHGWLHYTFEMPPTTAPLPRKVWEQPHIENLTGSPSAYIPPGSLHQKTDHQRSDYTPWTPE